MKEMSMQVTMFLHQVRMDSSWVSELITTNENICFVFSISMHGSGGMGLSIINKENKKKYLFIILIMHYSPTSYIHCTVQTASDKNTYTTTSTTTMA